MSLCRALPLGPPPWGLMLFTCCSAGAILQPGFRHAMEAAATALCPGMAGSREQPHVPRTPAKWPGAGGIVWGLTCQPVKDEVLPTPHLTPELTGNMLRILCCSGRVFFSAGDGTRVWDMLSRHAHHLSHTLNLSALSFYFQVVSSFCRAVGVSVPSDQDPLISTAHATIPGPLWVLLANYPT